MTVVLKEYVIAKGVYALHSRVASLALRAIHLLAIRFSLHEIRFYGIIEKKRRCSP